jgi:hypothetical protein
MISWRGLSMLDGHIALAVICFMQLAWETRENPRDVELGHLMPSWRLWWPPGADNPSLAFKQ